MRLIGFSAREFRGIRIIKFKGSLDLEFATKMRGELHRITGSHPEKDVILNLHDVDLIDSYGLSLLLSLRFRLEERGKRIALCLPERFIRKIFELTDNSSQYEIFENESHAIDAFSKKWGPALEKWERAESLASSAMTGS